MATKSDELETAQKLKKATRACWVATNDCQMLLDRTEEMLRRSEQDNRAERRSAKWEGIR